MPGCGQAADQRAALLTASAASLRLLFPGTANSGAICESLASSSSQALNVTPELSNVIMETATIKKKNPTQNFPVSQQIVTLYFLARFLECAFQVIDRPLSDVFGWKKSI